MTTTGSNPRERDLCDSKGDPAAVSGHVPVTSMGSARADYWRNPTVRSTRSGTPPRCRHAVRGAPYGAPGKKPRNLRHATEPERTRGLRRDRPAATAGGRRHRHDRAQATVLCAADQCDRRDPGVRPRGRTRRPWRTRSDPDHHGAAGQPGAGRPELVALPCDRPPPPSPLILGPGRSAYGPAGPRAGRRVPRRYRRSWEMIPPRYVGDDGDNSEERTPPMPVGMDQLANDLLGETEALRVLLVGLDDADWERPTPAEGWA